MFLTPINVGFCISPELPGTKLEISKQIDWKSLLKKNTREKVFKASLK